MLHAIGRERLDRLRVAGSGGLLEKLLGLFRFAGQASFPMVQQIPHDVQRASVALLTSEEEIFRALVLVHRHTLPEQLHHPEIELRGAHPEICGEPVEPQRALQVWGNPQSQPIVIT